MINVEIKANICNESTPINPFLYYNGNNKIAEFIFCLQVASSVTHHRTIKHFLGNLPNADSIMLNENLQ